MTWDPASLDGAANIRIAVAISLTRVSDGAAVGLYWSDGAFTGSHVDGTIRQWDGRIQRWRIQLRAQRLLSSRWVPPTAELSISLGGSDDTLWTYLDLSAYVWDHASATVYLVDMDQEAGAGAEVYLTGEVDGGPTDVQIHSGFSLRLIDARARVTLPVPLLSRPSPRWTGFVQPARQGNTTLNGAIDADDTKIYITALSAQWSQFRVAVCQSEAMYITTTGTDGGGDYLMVSRGYANTTAAAHADTTAIDVYRNGVHAGLAPGFDRVIPYVFGRSAADRGVVVEAIASGFEDVGATGNIEFWLSAGKIDSCDGFWDLDSSASGAITSRVVTTWNDLDTPNTGGSYHRTPNILLAGSYVDAFALATRPWSQDADRAWARLSGIIDGTGVIRYPWQASQWLIENSTWACGLSSALYPGRITGADAGDWPDQYPTETYVDDIAGIVPGNGSSDIPLLMDVLQDLAALIGSEWTTRGGYLYPYRLRIASSDATTLTITAAELLDGWPTQTEDPDGVYSTSVRLECKQDILCDPDPATEMEPWAIPYEVTVRDDDAYDLLGEEIVREFEALYWWIRPDSAFTPRTTGTETWDHIETLRACADDLVQLVAQRQVWMRATLTHRALECWPGTVVAYSISPYPTNRGLVRAMTVEGRDGIIAVTLESWHLATWPGA